MLSKWVSNDILDMKGLMPLPGPSELRAASPETREAGRAMSRAVCSIGRDGPPSTQLSPTQLGGTQADQYLPGSLLDPLTFQG